MSEYFELAQTLGKIQNAFDSYKQANDEILAEIKKGGERPETKAKLDKINAELNELNDLKKKIEKLETHSARGGSRSATDSKTLPEAEAHKTAFERAFRRKFKDHATVASLKKAEKDWRLAMQVRDDADEWELEQRAAQVSTLTGPAGGFSVPELISTEIERFGVDISPIRRLATVEKVGTPDYKKLIDLSNNGFEWLGENATRAQTSSADFHEVQPTFGTASARPRITEEALEDMFFDAPAWLYASANEALNQGEGAAYVSGSGVNRPTGFLTGTPVSTSDATRAAGVLQFRASGQAAAMPANIDPLIDLVYDLRSVYRSNAKWLMNRATLSQIRKYKDTTGQYLFVPGNGPGVLDKFLGFEVVEVEDMPNVAANAFPIAFGDFRRGYLIADRVGMRMTVDDISQPGFVTFYIRKRVGGRVMNSQAIKLLRISAS